MTVPPLFTSIFWHALPGALLLAYAVGWLVVELMR